MNAMLASPGQKRILIVDDEPALVQMMKICLSRENFVVTVARTGSEGLDRFAEQAFDLVISDRSIPEMGGDALARAIKDRAPSTPIILISGNGGLEVNVALFESFLAKPFTRTELIAAIDDAMSGGEG